MPENEEETTIENLKGMEKVIIIKEGKYPWVTQLSGMKMRTDIGLFKEEFIGIPETVFDEKIEDFIDYHTKNGDDTEILMTIDGEMKYIFFIPLDDFLERIKSFLVDEGVRLNDLVFYSEEYSPPLIINRIVELADMIISTNNILREEDYNDELLTDDYIRDYLVDKLHQDRPDLI